MRKLLLTALIIITCTCPSFSQKGSPITESSIVKDTTGNVIPYNIWTRLMITGRYKIKSQKDSPEFVIYRLSDEEYEKVLENLPKPPESKFFRTGGNFTHFKTTDIDDNKVNTKNLTGKIIVLNFWFINCKPCIMEMPELNKLTEAYKSDSSVVFFAIALDRKDDIELFLKTTRFGYTIIDNGRFIADQYKINGYPTNVVIDQKGKVYFHSTGLSTSTVHWLKKSIDELKSYGEKKDATAKAE